ncbi:hypothetical protein OF83DRAFT_1178278 [Amylostereum chailletii]|nr:hypothetical protein OF83DRAFT_1178278 [Amylostereum chailletii]
MDHKGYMLHRPVTGDSGMHVELAWLFKPSDLMAFSPSRIHLLRRPSPHLLPTLSLHFTLRAAMDQFWLDIPAADNWHELVGNSQDTYQPILTVADLAAGNFKVDRILNIARIFILCAFRMLAARIGDPMYSNNDAINSFWLLLVGLVPDFLISGVVEPVNVWTHLIWLVHRGWGAIIEPYLKSFHIKWTQGVRRSAVDIRRWLGHPATMPTMQGRQLEQAWGAWLQISARLLHIMHHGGTDFGRLWIGFFMRYIFYIYYFSCEGRIGRSMHLVHVFDNPDTAFEWLWVQLGSIAVVQLRHLCWMQANPNTHREEPSKDPEAYEEMRSILANAFTMYMNANPAPIQDLRAMICTQI